MTSFNAATGPWLLPGIEDRLIALHTAQLGFTAIARRLSEEYGVTLTKNAIAGRVHRLCLPLRIKHHVEKQRESRAKAVHDFTPPVRIEAPKQVHTDGMVEFLELRDDICHWPHGEFPNYRYCGKPKFHRSYCCEHFHIAYVVPNKRCG